MVSVTQCRTTLFFLFSIRDIALQCPSTRRCLLGIDCENKGAKLVLEFEQLWDEMLSFGSKSRGCSITSLSTPSSRKNRLTEIKLEGKEVISVVQFKSTYERTHETAHTVTTRQVEINRSSIHLHLHLVWNQLNLSFPTI